VECQFVTEIIPVLEFVVISTLEACLGIFW
jgi:hypothetical protein